MPEGRSGANPWLERNRELFLRAKAGDNNAEHDFFASNLGLAYSAVKRFMWTGLDPDDLLSTAFTSLFKAYQKWDPDGKASFSLYATNLINWEIACLVRYYKREKRNIPQMSLDVSTIRNGKGEAVALLAFIASTEDTERAVLDQVLMEKVHESILSLREPDQELAEMYLFSEMSVSEIARHYGVSRQAIHVKINRVQNGLRLALKDFLAEPGVIGA